LAKHIYEEILQLVFLGRSMKAIHILLIAICFSMITFSLFGNACSALGQDEAAASGYWNNPNHYPGSSGTFTITFISNSSDQLTIYYVGVHFDWMASDVFVGLNLQNSPVNVTSHGSHTFESMIILIPANASLGSHSYYIGIDGTQGANNAIFSWDSQPFSILIQASTQPTPTPTQSPTNGGSDQINLLLLIVGAAIIAVVVVLLLVMILKRKRKPSQEPIVTPTQTVTSPPQPVTPTQPKETEVSQPSLSGDTVTRLEKLKELKDKKLITEEEYEKKKDEILSQV
jgi:flagellar basal body-associated protein FliL